MSELSVIVEFETLEGAEPEFVRIISDHANRTRLEEPGCVRFEIIKPLGEDGEPLPNRVTASELYKDRAALDAHNASPRMAPLRETIAPLLKSRRLVLSRVLTPSPRKEEGISPADLNAANDG